MNGKDKEFFEELFKEFRTEQMQQGKAIARLEEKWSMAWKFFGAVSGSIALITTVVVRIFWR